MNEVVILSAVRTPIGKMGRSLASLSSVDLGTLAAKAAIKQAHIAPETIDRSTGSCRATTPWTLWPA